MGSLTGKQDQAYQRGQANPEEKGAYGGNSAIASGLPMLGNIDNSTPYDLNGVVASTENNVTPQAMVNEAEFNMSDPMVEAPPLNYNAIAERMLRNGDTLSDLSPSQQKQLTEGDGFIHAISSNIVNKIKDPTKAQETLDGVLDTLGFDMGELNSRASAANRFANGVADTAMSAYNGAGNIVGGLTGGALGDESPNSQDMSDRMEESLDAQTKADSNLYSSLNIDSKYKAGMAGDVFTGAEEDGIKKATDIATTVGQEAPAFVLGGAGSAIPKTAVAMESGLELMKGASDTKELSPTNILAPAVGFGLAKMLSNKLGRTFESIEDYEKAVRAEPHLDKQLRDLAKEKGIDIKAIETGKALNKPEDYADAGIRDDGIISEAWVRSEAHTDIKAYNEARSNAYEAFEKDHNGAMTDEQFNTAYDKKLPEALAANSDTFDEFLASVVESSDILKQADMTDLVSWAKNMQKLSNADKLTALEKMGMGAGSSIVTGVPLLNKLLPNIVNKYMSSMYGSAKRGLKKTLTKPRFQGTTL